MELKELKQAILDGSLSDEIIIFKIVTNNQNKSKLDTNTVKDNIKFLIEQYISEICAMRNLSKKISETSSITDVINSPLRLVMPQEVELTVFDLSTELNEQLINYDNLHNIVVICDKINTKLANNLASYIVEVTEPLEWQIKDYIKVLCNNSLTDDSIDWLYKAAKGNLYRIKNELDKVNLFESKERQQIFTGISTISYDLTTVDSDIFKLKDNIINKNLAAIYDVLKHKDILNIDIVSLSTILLREFKNILLVTQKSGKTPTELGLSDKQAFVIRSRYGKFSQETLLEEIKFLSSIDYRVKNGLLELSNAAGIDYIVSNVLNRL